MPRILYNAVPSANSVRVRILLHEKALEYQCRCSTITATRFIGCAHR
jgi:hypothetical protein